MFDAIHRHLLTLLPPPRPREEWRGLFPSPWSGPEDGMGFVLFEGDEPVALMGTLFSERPVGERRERFCNVTSWVATEPYRGEASLLALQLRRLRGHTITNLTPTPDAFRIFTRLGFEPLEVQRTVFWPGGALLRPLGPRGVRLSHDPGELEAVLDDVHREILEAHRGLAHHLAAWDDGGYCYLVYTVDPRPLAPRVRVHMLSEPERFVAFLPRIQRHWLRRHRALSAECDARFLRGVEVPFSLRRTRATPRLYRSGSVDPADIDNLYSELVLLNLP